MDTDYESITRDFYKLYKLITLVVGVVFVKEYVPSDNLLKS